MDTKERLAVAQWVLERNLGWIAAAEVKVGVIAAINIAMLGGLGAAFSQAATGTPWGYVLSVAATALLAAGLFCVAMAVLPKTTGPTKSLLFFGRIGPCADADYTTAFRSATPDELLEDWLAQIHRNAQIACEKFRWVRNGMWWSLLSVLPWFCAIVVLLPGGQWSRA